MSKDIKPIFVVKVPFQLTQQEVSVISKNLNKQLDDYHTVLTFTHSKEIEFEAFYPKDFDEKEMQEIKDNIAQKLEESINKYKKKENG